ncbi:MAG TPA: ATP-binding protein [Candidatus Limnocylindrales bacterium]|nr:ATP-binding protein [Candidatus Limnocylindrales bacterium]
MIPSLVVFLLLGTGALLAGLARLVLPATRRLAWSTTIVAAVAGAGLAWLPLDLLATPVDPVVRLLVGVAGAILAVGVSSVVLIERERLRARGAPDLTIEQLVAAGENDRVELKSTARWNIRTSQKDPRMEEEVVITMAGFLNATGGTLILGVADDGTFVGLEDDYRVTPGKDRDGFEVWLRQLLAARLGRAAVADAGVRFRVIDGKEVCRIDVAPADKPVFVRSAGGAPTADFHLRVGNATRRLLTDEVLDYQARRWG